MQEALFEVMPTVPVEEHILKTYFTSAYERDTLIAAGWTPENPSAVTGIAVKAKRLLGEYN
jgi:hypothetical protein